MSVEKINTASKTLIQAVANNTTLQSVLLEGSVSIDNLKPLRESKVLQEFLDAPIGSEKDTQIKQIIASAILIAKQNDFYQISTDLRLSFYKVHLT